MLIVPTLYYLFDVVGIKSAEAFITLNKEILNTSHKTLNGAMDNTVAAASCVYCTVIIIQDLYFIALTINLFTNRGVKPYAMLLGNMYQDNILNFNRVMRHIVVTKASTDGVYLTKLPKNMQPNNIAFKNSFTTIEEELY